jgi:uncharacterized protein YbjQ (UPF0145 family)
MHKQLICVAGLLLGSTISAAHAADRTVMLPITAAMESSDAKEKLGDSVKFYFGDQPVHGKTTALGTNKTSQKTNAFGKADATACNWVFLSAMIQLQKHANAIGANAVTNIRSNYNNVEKSSTTEFECHAGALMAGVALKADFVKVAQ